MRVLYITYDGLTDPLGGSQVLPYLRELAYRGHRITVLSCEKSDRLAMGGEDVAQQCAGAGIVWRALSYHQSPPVVSTLYDLARMQIEAARLQRSRPFDLVHCRSYLPALAGLSLKHRFGLPFVFDMRGFWPEERVESGDWKLANPLFRAVFSFFKNREKILGFGAGAASAALVASGASKGTGLNTLVNKGWDAAKGFFIPPDQTAPTAAAATPSAAPMMMPTPRSADPTIRFAPASIGGMDAKTLLLLGGLGLGVLVLFRTKK